MNILLKMKYFSSSYQFLEMSMIIYISQNVFEMNMVDPWTTWVWNVHLYFFFFNCKLYSIIGPALCTDQNPYTAYRWPSVYVVLPYLCSTVLFTIEKDSCISRSMQFNTMLFKGQLYYSVCLRQNPLMQKCGYRGTGYMEG